MASVIDYFKLSPILPPGDYNETKNARGLEAINSASSTERLIDYRILQTAQSWPNAFLQKEERTQESLSKLLKESVYKSQQACHPFISKPRYKNGVPAIKNKLSREYVTDMARRLR